MMTLDLRVHVMDKHEEDYLLRRFNPKTDLSPKDFVGHITNPISYQRTLQSMKLNLHRILQ
jgi:hypothetical protein